MAPADDEWPAPDWQYVHKHHSLPTETWADVLASTKGKYGNSRYKIGREEVRRIELESVTGQGNEILPRKGGHERHFWRKLDHDIGASKGSRTSYIYVVYHFSGGAVHGYPVTKNWLKSIDGVKL